MNSTEKTTSKKVILISVILTVIVTVLFWLVVAYLIFMNQFFSGGRRSLDDFTDSVKAACYEAELRLPSSCEFVWGEQESTLRETAYWVVFTVPKEEIDSLCSGSWQDATGDGFTEPLPDGVEDLIFVSHKKTVGVYECNGELSVTAPTADGRVYCYLYLSKG